MNVDLKMKHRLISQQSPSICFTQNWHLMHLEDYKNIFVEYKLGQ